MPIETKAITSSQFLFNLVEEARREAFAWVEEQKLEQAVQNDDLDEALEVAQGCNWSWEEWDNFVQCLTQAKNLVRAPIAFTEDEADLEKTWNELDKLTTIMDRFEQLVGCYLDYFLR